MRVCFVAHSSADEGAGRALLETVEVLKDLGVDCRVFLPRPGTMQEELSRLDVHCFLLKYCWWMGKGDSLWMRSRRTLRNLATTVPAVLRLREWRPDVVVSNSVTVVIGAVAACLLRIPHIWSLHEFGYEDHGLRFDLGDRFSYRVIQSLSAVCIVNSDVVAAQYAKHISPSRLSRVYYSMHLAQNARLIHSNSPVPARKSQCRCVIVGTLCEAKGQTDAVAALAELQKEGITPELLIVGKGEADYERYLRDLVRAHNLGNQVVFTGQVQDAFPFIQSADAVLMCSRSEAFGRVTVEGMLAGKPVIGARSGATPELVQDGSSGLLYQPGDPKDLAARIKYFQQNPAVAEELGRKGQEWAKATFSEDRHCAEFLEILNEVTRAKRPSQ